jgi:hypothetical protein
MALPDSLPALRHYLDEHEANPQLRAEAYEAYARGDEKALEMALDKVVFWGGILMESIGHPVEEVPTEEEEPTPEELEAAEAGDGEDFDPDEEGLEPYDPPKPEGGTGKIRQGDEWKGDDFEEDWESQGEEWRGDG